MRCRRPPIRFVTADSLSFDNMYILMLNGAKDRSGLPAQPAGGVMPCGCFAACIQASALRSYASARMRPDSPALTRQPAALLATGRLPVLRKRLTPKNRVRRSTVLRPPRRATYLITPRRCVRFARSVCPSGQDILLQHDLFHVGDAAFRRSLYARCTLVDGSN